MKSLREDLAGQRQLRFHLDGHPAVLHLFKAKGESTHQVFLKVLAYAFWGAYGELAFEPKTHHKLGPSLASIDYAGEVRLWVHVGPLPFEKLEHVLRHTDAEEVCWVLEASGEGEELETELASLVQRIRRHVHYRYTDRRLRVLLFAPLEGWFDPAHVVLDPARYGYHSF
ncbi:MAG: hypothetical protein VKS61_05740 [Candidatus Sericytochromatia bacterium]|nr:hypothetical protein [Candidatus Sericytochromatia bacterium]